MTQAQRGTTARVVKKLLPQEAGARERAAELGDRLLCVRYRVDPQSQRRQATVELVVEEAPTLASVRVGVRIAWAETDLRRRVKAGSGCTSPSIDMSADSRLEVDVSVPFESR